MQTISSEYFSLKTLDTIPAQTSHNAMRLDDNSNGGWRPRRLINMLPFINALQGFIIGIIANAGRSEVGWRRLPW